MELFGVFKLYEHSIIVVDFVVYAGRIVERNVVNAEWNVVFTYEM